MNRHLTANKNGQQAEGQSEEVRKRNEGLDKVDGDIEQLRAAYWESEALFITASEHAQNRGLKLLLKVYAYYRRKAAEELAAAMQNRSADGETNDSPIQGMHQGVVDIQAAMTVGRENRTHVVLEELLTKENELARRFEDALLHDVPEHLRLTMQRQSDQQQVMHHQLRWLTQDGYEDLVVRLFDERSDAESAIEHLGRLGLDRQYVTMADVKDLPIFPGQQDSLSGATKNTMLAGIVTGAIFGAMFGLAAAGVQWLVPMLSDMIVIESWLLAVSGAAIGALFGGIFGALIGTSTREDDTYLFEESLREGDTMLIVHANDANMPDVLDALKLYHERELTR